MLLRGRFALATIKQSLKILQLQTPIKKSIVKKQYLSLAKKYHPDSTNTQSQEKFIQIGKAYQHLKDLTQDEINRQEETPQKQEKIRKTQEEKAREETYSYFNSLHQEIKKEEQKYRSKPFYRTVPQLFIGLLLLGAALGEWTYISYKKPQKKKQVSFNEVYKGFNNKKKYNQ